jgi:hypothetical protein
MTRLLAAALVLTLAAAPAFACEWNRSASVPHRTNTATSQPADDQGTPPPSTPTDQKPG